MAVSRIPTGPAGLQQVIDLTRIITYVDGFNLYFGLRSKGWKRYYWLDIGRLATNLLKPGQTLQKTKYFTSRIIVPPAKAKRQATYIEALETLDRFEIFYGKYQLNDRVCPKCGFVQRVPFENDRCQYCYGDSG